MDFPSEMHRDVCHFYSSVNKCMDFCITQGVQGRTLAFSAIKVSLRVTCEQTIRSSYFISSLYKLGMKSFAPFSQPLFKSCITGHQYLSVSVSRMMSLRGQIPHLCPFHYGVPSWGDAERYPPLLLGFLLACFLCYLL